MVPVIYCATDSFLTFWAIFWSLTLLTTWKIKILKKWKKHLEILSFYTCVPQITIIWGMVPDTWSSTDQIFCHFGSFFALSPKTWKIKILKKWQKHWEKHHSTLVYHKWQLYDIWFLRYGAWQTELFLILDHFLPFKPWELRKSKFWKNEKGWTSSFYVSVPKIIGAPLKKTPK